jgi:hypothetical protein
MEICIRKRGDKKEGGTVEEVIQIPLALYKEVMGKGVQHLLYIH